MKFGKLRALHGPNVWARVPVIEVEVEPGDPREWPADLDVRWAEQRSAFDGRGTDRPAEDVRRAWGPARALAQVALELQCLAGCETSFGEARQGLVPGLWHIAVEFEEELVGRACLEVAWQWCLSIRANRPFDLSGAVEKLRELRLNVGLGPSTAAIVRAAKRRGIPVRRLNEASLVQLGHGAAARRICTAETDRTGVVAEAIAGDKELTRSLLRTAGVPVPEGRAVRDADDAWQAAEDIGLPVVVKPRDGNQGRGVATNLTTREGVTRAFAAALAESDQVLVERHIPGADYRLLVINGQLTAAAAREPAQVLGDGCSTILQLIEEVNRDPRRSDGHATSLSFIKLDSVALGVLAEQGFSPESVPLDGERVLVRRNGNLSTGGIAADVTDRVHPEVSARAVEAARVVGLDIAGIDVVTPDITRALEAVGGAIVEVNAGPGLRMHLEPSSGKARPVGEAIVEMLFPSGRTGRIPIAAVTGVNGPTTTRLLAHLLGQAGFLVGMTSSDGIYLDGRRVEDSDCSGSRHARSVLLNPRVEAAIFEAACAGILREGLGFEQCDVAVVTNASLCGVGTLMELAQVERTVVEAVAPGGAAILNATDRVVASMGAHCPGSVIFFALDGEVPTLTTHVRARGRAVFVRDGTIVLKAGEVEKVLLELGRVPWSDEGKVAVQGENILAAAAAAWALRLPLDSIRTGLETFVGEVTGHRGQRPLVRVREGT